MIAAGYIAGTGMTKFGSSNKSLLELIIDAAEEALKSSNLDPCMIDEIIISTQDAPGFAGEGNIGAKVADAYSHHFKVPLPTSKESSAASASGSAALHDGYRMTKLEALKGNSYHLLVIGAEKMTGVEEPAKLIAKVLDPQSRINGKTMLSIAAEVMGIYQKEHGLSYEDLDEMAIQLHLRAARNPNARFYGNSLIEEEIRAAVKNPEKNKVVVPGTEYRRYHATSIDDGAAAVVLTTKPTDIKIVGIGQGNAPMRLEDRHGWYGFEATKIAADNAYQMSGLQPENLRGNSILEVHDAFLPYVFPQLVAMGFYKTLEDSIMAFRNGDFNNGVLPVNRSGGLKGRGHPLGASGVAQVVEIIRQMRGQAAESLQLAMPIEYGVAAAIGGFATVNFVTIIQNKAYTPAK